MADVQLFDLGDGGDVEHVEAREAVTRCHLQTERVSQRRSVLQTLELGGALGALLVAVLTGVKLHLARAELARQAHVGLVWRDEQAELDFAARAHAGHFFDRDARERDIQPAFGGQLGATLGDQGHDVRADALGDGGHLVRGAHLQVEHGGQRAAQTHDVVVFDVPAIFPQVRGDAVSASELAQSGCGDRVGIDGAARIADRGHVVDVDVESNHGLPPSLTRLRVCCADALGGMSLQQRKPRW